MPTAPRQPDEPPPPPTDRGPRRVVVDPAGPVLVEGPVEVELPDGTTACSDRFMVALCVCRRSRTFPWCDTSHRRRSREPEAAPGAPPGGSVQGLQGDQER